MSGFLARDSGAASGLLQTMRYSGGAIGLAVLTIASAHHTLAHGITNAFETATILAASPLLVTVALIRDW